jgi:hypothetical protein
MKRSKHSIERSEHLYRYLGIGLLLMTVGCAKPDTLSTKVPVPALATHPNICVGRANPFWCDKHMSVKQLNQSQWPTGTFIYIIGPVTSDTD